MSGTEVFANSTGSIRPIDEISSSFSINDSTVAIAALIGTVVWPRSVTVKKPLSATFNRLHTRIDHNLQPLVTQPQRVHH